MLQKATELLFDSDTRTVGATTDHFLVKIYGDLVKHDDFMMAMLYVFQGAVYFAWGDHERGLALTLNTGILLDKLLSHSANMPSLFHQCFALYASSRKSSRVTGRRRLKRLGLKRHAILRRWAKDGCCNVVHYVAVLDAELAILNGATKEKVEDLYQKAVVLAARGGWIQDAAVATERLAQYFRDRGDLEEAGRRFEQAIAFYDDWGFTTKSKLLSEERNDEISFWLKSRGLRPDQLDNGDKDSAMV